MPISLQLRTTCERCEDPLPLNGWATEITCWSCLHENPVSPEEWSNLLGGALADAWSYDVGAGLTESRKVGSRTFELRWANAGRARGARRKRPREMRRDLFPGVVALAGEERETPALAETVAFTCPQCAGALQIDGRSREVTCSFCTATSLLGDDVWRRLHPVHAQKRWFLVLEDDEGDADEEETASSEKEETSPRFAVGVQGDVTVGPDGLLYAAGTFEGVRPALWCMDADLRVRWRVDVKRSTLGPVRVAVVGDTIWYVDAQRHDVRRYARADGAALGALGGPEPVGAKTHHLDLRGACEVVGNTDGSVLALVVNRIVRFDSNGTGVLTWPARTGLMSWFSKESLWPLYKGPLPPGEDDDGMFVSRPHAELSSDHLGADRPTATMTVTTRAVASSTGDTWLSTGAVVHHYGRDGTLRWSTPLEGCSDGLPTRPGLGRDGHLFVLTHDRKGRPVLFRLAPDGKATRLTREGLGSPIALAATPDGRVLLFGSEVGDVRTFDHDGKPLRATGAAVAVDREAGDGDDE
ncbi:MAG: hypothetical protein V4850_08110 [Myxococcota bacterium]